MRCPKQLITGQPFSINVIWLIDNEELQTISADYDNGGRLNSVMHQLLLPDSETRKEKALEGNSPAEPVSTMRITPSTQDDASSNNWEIELTQTERTPPVPHSGLQRMQTRSSERRENALQ